MATPKYDIYIYQLTNGKYLLYPTNNGFSEDTVKKECRFIYYECLRNTQIESLVKIKVNIDACQIDGIVHLYMHLFGIDNVRGGQYKRATIPDDIKEYISQSIKYFTNDLDEDEQHIIKCQNYENREITEIYNLYREYNRLIQELDKYSTNQQCTNQQCTNQQCTNQQLLIELKWLADIIKTPVPKFFDIETRYYKLMKELGNIYKRYINIFEFSSREIASIYKGKCDNWVEEHLRTPVLYLDSRVIFEERIRETNDFTKKDKIILDIYNMIVYSFINREDEILFELSQIDIRCIETMRHLELATQ